MSGTADGSPERAVSALRPLSLRRNFVWTFAGNVVYAASQWGVLVVLAKVGSPGMVGQFALAAAVCAPIVIFLQLQLRALQVTDAKREFVFSQYLGLRLVAMGVAAGIATAIGLTAYEPEIALLILLVAVNQGMAACRDIFFGAMQSQERMDYVSIGQMISGPLNLAFLGVVILTTGSLHAAVAAAIIAKVIMLLSYDRPRVSRILRATAAGNPSAGRLRPSFAAVPLWSLIKQGLPLGLVMMLINAGTNVPRYFIEALHGEAMLGYFAAIAALLQAGTMVSSALGQSASPRLSRYYRENVPAFRRLLIKLLASGALVGIAGIAVAVLLGRPILTILFTPEYAEYANILVLIMIAGGITYMASFTGFAMTAARYLKVQVPINALVLVVILVGSWALIGPYGLTGAALSLIGGALARLGTQGFVVACAVARRKRELRAGTP